MLARTVPTRSRVRFLAAAVGCKLATDGYKQGRIQKFFWGGGWVIERDEFCPKEHQASLTCCKENLSEGVRTPSLLSGYVPGYKYCLLLPSFSSH